MQATHLHRRGPTGRHDGRGTTQPTPAGPVADPVASGLVAADPFAADPYVVVAAAPPRADYLRLRRDSGLPPKRPEQADGALAGSWSWCHVRTADGTVVAMGRVVGDGGWYFLVADMAVDPAHQRRGLGRRVLTRLLDDVRARAPRGAYITLVADPPGRALYESLGFRDVAPGATGMVLDLGLPEG
ncbi:GNAT family N-acetyltransferase [Cellulomonas endometrii]|uniref:GNAT family N-acetyltransferase n=1 Tax=Cellulomonas endometrii TaxID=3036301 RepID=UPI0031F845D1